MYLFTTISNKLIHKSSSVFNLTYRIHQDAAAGNALSGSLSYLVLPEENPSLNNCDEVGAWHCTPSKWYVSLYKINFMDINVPALTLTSIPRLHRCFKLVWVHSGQHHCRRANDSINGEQSSISSSVICLWLKLLTPYDILSSTSYTSVLNHREQQPQLLQPTPPRILPTPTMEGTYPETETTTVFLLSSLFGEPIAQGIIKRWILSSLLWEKRFRHQ